MSGWVNDRISRWNACSCINSADNKLNPYLASKKNLLARRKTVQFIELPAEEANGAFYG